MRYLVKMHSMISIECYLCSFDLHLVLVAEVFVVLLEDENIHLVAHIFLAFHLGGYLEGMETVLLMCVRQLVLVFGE